MTCGDRVTATVEALAYGGDGIARIEGRVIFIPETIQGEMVSIRISQIKKRYARAELLKILKPSPLRRNPCCRVIQPDTGTACRVPGCVYDHLDYAAEVLTKQQQLEGFVRRLPDSGEAVFLPPVASPSSLHYRNKIVLHCQRNQGEARLGYRQEPSHHVLDIASCPLACAEINAALSSLRSSALLNRLHDDARITLRHTAHDGAVWWLNNTVPTHKPCDGFLTEDSPIGPLCVPRDGFYQVNPAVGNELVRTAAKWFADNNIAPEILDLYCGVGVFGFACLKSGGTHLTGIESGRTAIAAAQQNARRLGIPGTFLCSALGKETNPLNSVIRNPRITTILVDPPRDGLAPEIAHALANRGTRRLFYVSCDPATLARDLTVLLLSGYHILRAQLFDMFPRTAHFESLIELIRD